MRRSIPRFTLALSSAFAQSPAIHRSFAREVECRLRRLNGAALETLCVLGYGLHRYRLYAVEFPRRDSGAHDDRRSVLLSAGVHGDEPAGVHAALDFLSNIAPSLSRHFRFLVLPCVNPSGYEANTLETMNGVNLNRLFGRQSAQPEVKAIEDWLGERDPQFRVCFDLHEAPPYYVGEGFVESDNPRATYLYESVTDASQRLGHQMIAALEEDMEVCEWPTIYDDVNDHGVIGYPDACRNTTYAEGTSLDSFLSGRFTGHSFTTETPTVWNMEKRIRTHLIYVETALRSIARESPRRYVRARAE